MRLFKDIFHCLAGTAFFAFGFFVASCQDKLREEGFDGAMDRAVRFTADVADATVATRSEGTNPERDLGVFENGEGNFVAVLESYYSPLVSCEPETRASVVTSIDLQSTGFYVTCFVTDPDDASRWDPVWDNVHFSLIASGDPDYSSWYNYYKGGRIWPGTDPGYHFIANNLGSFAHEGDDYYLVADNTSDAVVSVLEDAVYPSGNVKSNVLTFEHILGRLGDVSVSFDTGVTVSNLDVRLVAADAGRYHVMNGEWSDLHMVEFSGIANADGSTKSNDVWLVPGTYDMIMTYDYVMYGVERTGRSACSRVIINAGQIASISIFFTEEEEPLTFEAVSNGNLTYTQPSDYAYSSNDRVDISINGGEWETYFASHGRTISVSAGDKLRVRNPYSSTLRRSRFYSDCPMYAYGNVGSLLIYTQSSRYVMQYALEGLFQNWTNLRSHPVKDLKFPEWWYGTSSCSMMFSGCSSLERAPGISASRAEEHAFYEMFRDCTSLISTSGVNLGVLPAGSTYQCQRMFAFCTSLRNVGTVDYDSVLGSSSVSNSFYEMFRGCTSLVKAPALPHSDFTNLRYGYMYMFQDCTALREAPELPATVLEYGSYCNMFYGCTALETAPVLPASTVTTYGYSGMFYGCTSLVSAPELPALTLNNYCYQQMFENCTSLVSTPELPATTLPSGCYYGMFKGCSSLTNVQDIAATTMGATSCYEMFRNCTSLVTAPSLPAENLAASCYAYMFNGCTSLVNAPSMLPATTLQNNCYAYMFAACNSLQVAPDLPALTLVSSCYSNMFNECRNLRYVKAMFTTTPSSTYTSNWMNYVRSSGTFVKNSAATWNVRGGNGIPNGWTIQTASN